MTKNIKLRKRKEKKVIGNKTKHYIVLGIIGCCLAIGFNIHPNNKELSNSQEMIYIFHDYKRDSHILNDSFHGSADELDYLFDDTIPENLEQKDNKKNTAEKNNINNNQISIEEILKELGIDNEYSGNILILDEPSNYSGISENSLIIDLSNNKEQSGQIKDDTKYVVSEEGPTLTIIKSKKSIRLKNMGNFTDGNTKNKGSTIKSFQNIADSRILPSLMSADQFENIDNGTTFSDEISNNDNSKTNTENNENYKTIGGINILPDYADCTTPWGYKISHGESVLAYKQIDNAPNICNIERRLCWNGKLSGTYSQQGCVVKGSYSSTKEDYSTANSTNTTSNSYKQNQNNKTTYEINTNTTAKLNTQQNKDGSVSVYKPETESSFVFDNPSKTSTSFHHGNDNIKNDKPVEQTKKEHTNCITPRGEEVQHGQIVQAFKHANGFYDILCETQIRLCSMGKLEGSYTQKSCKNWESSFKNRFNGEANKDKYYQKKLEKIKQKIENEETYYNELKGLSEEEALDKIFYRLDE